MAEVVTTPDGRQLAYLEVGYPHGPLVLHNHGGPSSRLEARLQAACAATNELRLVCVDRSGRNLQTPVPNALLTVRPAWFAMRNSFTAVGLSM